MAIKMGFVMRIPMFSPLCSALKAGGVPAVLLAVGVAVACVSRDRIDPEAIEAEARRPSPLCPPGSREFRLPGPAAYPLRDRPWIKSRADFIAHLTRGEDPAVVRRHVEGPEDELIEYLGEVFLRSGHPGRRPLGRESGGRLVGRTRRPREAAGPSSPARTAPPPA